MEYNKGVQLHVLWRVKSFSSLFYHGQDFLLFAGISVDKVCRLCVHMWCSCEHVYCVRMCVRCGTYVCVWYVVCGGYVTLRFLCVCMRVWVSEWWNVWGLDKTSHVRPFNPCCNLDSLLMLFARDATALNCWCVREGKSSRELWRENCRGPCKCKCHEEVRAYQACAHRAAQHLLDSCKND